METRCLIDWLSTTSKGKLENNFRYVYPQIQQESEYTVHKGAINGYSKVLEHVLGTLVMSHPLYPDMGTHIIHNGTTLARLFRDRGISPIDMMGYYVRNGATTSRLDIAIDLFDSGLIIDDLSMDYDNGAIETRAKSGSYVESKPVGTGKTLYVGSTKKRKKLLRVYDKGAQSKLNIDWIRVEYEIHGKPATQASLILIEADDFDNAVKEIIKGYCNFPSNSIWLDTFNNVHKTNLRGDSEPIGDTKAWLLTTVCKSLAKMIVKDKTFLDVFLATLNRAVEEESGNGFGESG